MSESEYNQAIERIEQLMSAEPGTPDALELVALVKDVEAFEELRYPMGGLS